MSERSPTLEQLRVFITVAETGGFSAAAAALDRAQSVISYTVAHLEAQLGFALFERGRRRPELTEAGRTVLADARRVSLMMRELSARAAGMNRGIEGEVLLAVDVMFPAARLVSVLQAFAVEFPTVALTLQIEALGGVLKRVVEGESDLGISGPNEDWPDAVDVTEIGAVRLIAVTAPSHPLARYRGEIPMPVLREHIQLVLTDRSRMTEGQKFGVYATHVWLLGDLSARHQLLRAGLGWGSMPEHMILDDLATGALVPLSLAARQSIAYRVSLVHRVDAPPGPATRWLATRFRAVSERLM